MEIWVIILIFIIVILIGLSYYKLGQIIKGQIISGGKPIKKEWIPWNAGYFPEYIVKQAMMFSPQVDFTRLKQMGEVTQYSSLMPWHMPEENRILKLHIKDPKSIFDVTGHVGIGTINLATVFPDSQIEATEIDMPTCEVLRYNLETAIGQRATAVCGNGVDHLMSGKKWDVVYFDPPWGGRKYMEAKEMDLILKDSKGIDWTLDRLIDEINNHQLAKYVVFRATLNYHKLGELKNKYPGMVVEDVRSSLPHGKFGKVSYKLVIIPI